MDFKFRKYAVDVDFGLYGNGNLAMVFNGASGSEYEGEAIATATVNGDTVLNNPDVCGFKTWDSNVEIIDVLVKEDIIEDTPIHEEIAGYSTIQYYCLTGKGKRLRDACFDRRK